MDRRELIHLVAGTVAASSLVNTAATTSAEMPSEVDVKLNNGDVILFQGDSITDARRDKKKFADRANDPRGLGDGYPLRIAGQLIRNHPTKQLKCFNRGISGHKVPDLQKRWKKDCLDVKPAMLSILIGVNDIWHKMNGKYKGTVKDYRTGFTKLLKETKRGLPGVQIVVCEPFALRCGAVKDSWYPEFDQRRQVAVEVANAAGAIWVPFQTMFDTAIAAGSDPQVWAADGVHPTIAGHALMAETWMKVVGV